MKIRVKIQEGSTCPAKTESQRTAWADSLLKQAQASRENSLKYREVTGIQLL